ncbi:MAG: hypothetical protein K0R54_582 [Clostridiaceae bacterium]|nr:hypothetical protein [Clostridiaceae bacterium]
MKRTSFNEVCEVIREVFPEAGVISPLKTNSGNYANSGVFIYIKPGKDKIFRAKNNTELIEKIKLCKKAC